MEYLSERLAWALDRGNHTQVALADAVGVSKSAVSQWMNDQTANLQMAHLFAVARFLEVEPEWLAIGEGPRRSRAPSRKADAMAREISELSPAAQEALRVIIAELSGDA